MAMRPLPVILVAALATITRAASPEPDAQTLTGTIKSAAPITRIVAVDRDWADVEKVSKGISDDFVYEGVIDPQSAAFSIPHLLPGRTYDLILWNGQGRWEGVTMNYHRPITPDKPLASDDRDWLDKFVADTPSFYDKHRILSIAADHKHATVLVELQRTTEFHSAAHGELIYRTELWYFENYFGGWAKDNNTEKVLTRFRGNSAAFPAAWQYLPQLGGIEIPATGDPAPLVITLPDAPEKKHGLANSP